MDPRQSARIIAAAGGDAAFAKLIGLDPNKQGNSQRVNNWKRRGIPASVVLANLRVIRQLERKADSPGDDAPAQSA